MDEFKQILDTHAKRLAEHGERLDDHERRLNLVERGIRNMLNLIENLRADMMNLFSRAEAIWIDMRHGQRMHAWVDATLILFSIVGLIMLGVNAYLLWMGHR